MSNPKRGEIWLVDLEPTRGAESAEELEQALAAEGFRVARDTPFPGALVPLEYWQRDKRVIAVMVEVRRGLYCDEETGERGEGFEEVRESIGRAAGSALRM